MIEKIFILHHTHVDLGYTDLREKVCKDLVDMVDQTIALVESSLACAELEHFRWIHEVSWPVLEYLRCGGARSKTLFEYIRKGYIELTAFYVNPTDLFDKDSFEISIDFACKLAADNNLPLKTAMFSDCPGIAWSVVDILAERGIRYLSAAPNFTMSYPLEVERPFYWEGPAKGRVLTWFSEWRNSWYAEGLKVFKLHEDPVEAAQRLLTYLNTLEKDGYRWKGLAIHVAMDNQPPLPQLMDFVKYFNATTSDRQTVMATNYDFFEFMEYNHASEFAVHRGAWPDWWSNGNASAAYETACSRKTKISLRRSKELAETLGRQLDTEQLRDITEDMLLFDEHTWGHSTSVWEPWKTAARLQWSQKRAYALNAMQKAYSLENELAVQLPECKKNLKSRILFPELENDYFRINFDASCGAVTELYDKTCNYSLYDKLSEFSFAELIHERIRRGGREALYDFSYGETNPAAKRPCPDFVRKSAHTEKRKAKFTAGPVFNSLLTRGTLPGIRFVREIRLYHQIKRIDVILQLDKQIVTDYESLYVAFPFTLKDGQIWVEHAGAIYRPGIDQLPGSATDWLSVGEYVVISNKDHTIELVPHEAPLIQIGEINTGKWDRKLQIKNSHIYSWPMNNMWFTNFPAYQEGVIDFTWSLTTFTEPVNHIKAKDFVNSVNFDASINVKSILINS